MNSRILLFTLIILAMGTGCLNDLTKPESKNLELPPYSEFGRNTMGGYFNEKVMVGKSIDTMAMVKVSEQSTMLTMVGDIDQGNRIDKVTLTFATTLLAPDSFEGLKELDQQSIDLTAIDNWVKIWNRPIEVDDGALNVIKARNLIINKKQVGVILSGRFWLSGHIPEIGPVEILDGRFDVVIGAEQFSVE